MPNFLSGPIQNLKTVGPAKAHLLAKMGIFSIGDLVEHYPVRHEDRSQLKPIAALIDCRQETFQAKVLSVGEFKSHTRKAIIVTKVVVGDGVETVELLWFNQPFKKKLFKPGMDLLVSGKVERLPGKIQIVKNLDVEILDGKDLLNAGRIVPVYAATENINQRLLRALVHQALDGCQEIPEILPGEIVHQYSLLDRKTALNNIHFPQDWTMLARARQRLVFEELYLLQCGLLHTRYKNKEQFAGIKHGPDGSIVKQVEQALPFILTDDQRQALAEIKTDMEYAKPMVRLLQGDVGSGKTVIAALALAKTVENGYQGAMMVPTEILAEQHYQTLEHLYKPVGIKVALLTGKQTRQNHETILQNIINGQVHVIVGTHALIQENVEFKRLGLVITDEQHRFGVQQRARLQLKGYAPDALVMTATPIPRTMALTVYGDLDISIIRQLPPGRKMVKTYTVDSCMRSRVYTNLVAQEADKGHQAYIVCPLIEESEKLDTVAAVQLYDQLVETYFARIPCGLIHGRMKSREKESVMEDFRTGKIKILIATTVIEVGVNVPNATVMVIEGADRFGLAQLHQLRGRIGRGEHQSYCV